MINRYQCANHQEHQTLHTMHYKNDLKFLSTGMCWGHKNVSRNKWTFEIICY